MSFSMDSKKWAFAQTKRDDKEALYSFLMILGKDISRCSQRVEEIYFLFFSFLLFLVPKTAHRNLKFSGQGNFLSNFRNFDFRRVEWSPWSFFSLFPLTTWPQMQVFCRKYIAKKGEAPGFWMKDPRESPGKPESMGSSQENRQHTVVSEHVGTHELFLHGSDPKGTDKPTGGPSASSQTGYWVVQWERALNSSAKALEKKKMTF